MFVHGLGEREDRRLGGERDDEPDEGEGEGRQPATNLPRERAEPHEARKARPRLRLGERPHHRIVEAVDDQRVRPEEEAEVVEVGRPPGHEVPPRSDVARVRRRHDGRRQEDRAVGEPRDAEPGEPPDETERRPRSAGPGREEPVAEQCEGQGEDDLLRQQRQHEERDPRRPSVAHRGVEGGEVARCGHDGRACGDVVDGGRVERMDCHHEGRTRRDRQRRVAEPEVIADDPEDEHHHAPVEQEVQQVVAPRPLARDGVVEREAHQEKRAHQAILARHARAVRVDEETRDAGEAPDVRVLLNDVPVVEMETDGEAVRIRERDREPEEQRHPPPVRRPHAPALHHPSDRCKARAGPRPRRTSNRRCQGRASRSRF